jgi:uncharacterized protein involved in exopolysaccharide biosynthesis
MEPPDGDSNSTVQVQVNGTEPRSSVQLQIDASSIRTGRTMGQLSQWFDNLKRRLEAKMSIIDANLGVISSQILVLQGEVQSLQNRADRLTLERDVQLETYQTLSRKTQEARIAAQTSRGQIRVASHATVGKLEPSNAFRFSAVAGSLGLFAGIACAFALEWWRNGALVLTADRRAGLQASE